MRERERGMGEEVSTVGSRDSIWSRLPERQTLGIPGYLLKDLRQKHLGAVAAVPYWLKVAPGGNNPSSISGCASLGMLSSLYWNWRRLGP